MLYLEIKGETCEHITVEEKVGEICSKVYPKSVIRPQNVYSYDSMVLFPNIFSFLIGILLVFVT